MLETLTCLKTVLKSNLSSYLHQWEYNIEPTRSSDVMGRSHQVLFETLLSKSFLIPVLQSNLFELVKEFWQCCLVSISKAQHAWWGDNARRKAGNIFLPSSSWQSTTFFDRSRRRWHLCWTIQLIESLRAKGTPETFLWQILLPFWKYVKRSFPVVIVRPAATPNAKKGEE